VERDLEGRRFSPPAEPGQAGADFFILPESGSVGPVVCGAALSGEAAKEELVARLLGALARLDRRWAHLQGCQTITLHHGDLGQPRLTVAGAAGPSLSFSYSGDLLYGALAGSGRIGLDAALAAEFAAPYPLARVFGEAEWALARRLTQGDSGSAAALLWSLKEASVKALGVGFHRLDFLEVEVQDLMAHREGILCTVKARSCLPAWARTIPGGWLALALVVDINSDLKK